MQNLKLVMDVEVRHRTHTICNKVETDIYLTGAGNIGVDHTKYAIMRVTLVVKNVSNIYTGMLTVKSSVPEHLAIMATEHSALVVEE